MPLVSISSQHAVENLRGNSNAKWPNRKEGENRVEPITIPGINPSFQFNEGDAVFTVGSCFARNVESELELHGFDVPMRNLNLAISDEDETAKLKTGAVFNNYAAPSILNELIWALDPERPFDPDLHLLKIGEDKYHDLHLTKSARPLTLEQCMYRRANIKTGIASVKSCRIVVLTLGLIEVWYDSFAKTYLNIAPPRNAARKDPNRFQLHILRHSEVLDFLTQIYDLLDQHCAPGYKSLLTISPVPLHSTYSGVDVIQSNQYSKSTLRSAAQELVETRDNIDYFPSYESLILSDRQRAWADDMRHPTRELVSLNVSNMIRAYTSNGKRGGAADDFNMLDMSAAFEAEDFQKTLQISKTMLDINPNNVTALILGCRAAIRAQDWTTFKRLFPSLRKLHSGNYNQWTIPIGFQAARFLNDAEMYAELKPDLCEFPDTLTKLNQIVVSANFFADYAFVLELCTTGLQIFKRNTNLYFFSANAQLHLGDPAKAKATLERYFEKQDDRNDRGQRLLKRIEKALNT